MSWPTHDGLPSRPVVPNRHSGAMSTSAPPRPAVRIAGVSKTFRSGGRTLRAVDDIDLDIPRGQIMALLGPNGAGKTTTLDMVLGLTEPTAGQVSVDGQPPQIGRASCRERGEVPAGEGPGREDEQDHNRRED